MEIQNTGSVTISWIEALMWQSSTDKGKNAAAAAHPECLHTYSVTHTTTKTNTNKCSNSDRQLLSIH